MTYFLQFGTQNTCTPVLPKDDANKEISFEIYVVDGPTKGCPNSTLRTHTCLHINCPGCIARRTKEFDKRKGRAKRVKPTDGCIDHWNPKMLVDLDLTYVVGSYADAYRACESDNHLPTHCSECGGKFV